MKRLLRRLLGCPEPVAWGPVDLEGTARRWAEHHDLNEEWCLRWAAEIKKLAEGVHPWADAVRAETVLTKILYDTRLARERSDDGIRALLRVEKRFESGLVLPEGTPIYVKHLDSGAVGEFYPDPLQLSSHVFALDPSDYTVLVKAPRLRRSA